MLQAAKPFDLLVHGILRRSLYQNTTYNSVPLSWSTSGRWYKDHEPESIIRRGSEYFAVLEIVAETLL